MSTSQKIHEKNSYQDFMVSSDRKLFIEDSLYRKLIPHIQANENILDFGCGLGYVATFYAQEIATENIEAHVYACDYQEELLDMLWKQIVDHRLQKITPFFISNQNRIVFPQWIPPIHDAVFSFSFSAMKINTATEEPLHSLLQNIKKFFASDAKIHIVDWNPLCEDKSLKEIFSPEYRLSQEEVIQILEENNYKILKIHRQENNSRAKNQTNHPAIYALTAMPI